MRLSMITGLVVAGSLWGLPAAFADDTKPAKGDQEQAKLFQGRWKVVALEADGNKAPADALQGMRWSFSGTEIQANDPGEKEGGKFSMKIDANKSPKQIDLIGLQGPDKGKKAQGIYKFEKDRLIICLRDAESAAKGRPKEFMTEADSGLGMITLERIKE